MDSESFLQQDLDPLLKTDLNESNEIINEYEYDTNVDDDNNDDDNDNSQITEHVKKAPGRITLSMLTRSSPNLRRYKGETPKQYARRLTHIHLAGKGVREIDNLHLCPKLISLYLYENNISKIQGLHLCSTLTQLYLQHNNIEKMEGLLHLTNLKKLYLSHNKIIVVEGLHTLKLTEVYLDHQELPPGEQLLFDPRSMASSSNSLNTLDLSGNNLSDLDSISCLNSLTTLSITNNNLSLGDVTSLLGHNMGIRRLDVEGNARLCSSNRYREELIASSRNLIKLDGRDVTDTNRNFLKNWKAAAQASKESSPRDIHNFGPTVKQNPLIPKFPSKLSVKKHWLPPLPTSNTKS